MAWNLLGEFGTAREGSVVRIGRFLAVAFGAASLVLGISSSRAAAQMLGPEFRVNSYTTARQSDAAVAADGTGNFVVVWISNGPIGTGQDGSYSGIFGQRLDSSGLPLGAEFQANTYTTGWQLFPGVAADEAGNFVVAWGGDGPNGSGVLGQTFDATGTPAGSEFGIGSGGFGFPAAAASGIGNFLVVWESFPGPEIAGRRFGVAGIPLGEEFQVNSYTTGNQGVPEVTADGQGDFVVVWSSPGQDGSEYGVFGQRLDAAGSALGGEFQVNSYTIGSQSWPSVAAGRDGGFIVAWSSIGQDEQPYSVYGQRYDGAGNPLGQELKLNDSSPNGQPVPAVAVDESGQFLVAWQGREYGASDYGVFARLYDPEGRPLSSHFQVSSATALNSRHPAVATGGAGEFLVVWEAYTPGGAAADVFARRVRAPLFGDGFESGDACRWSLAQGGGCP
ncbi:MAG: hypothetical protein F9K18_04400 [Thermoanaerobaculia bacterium]|nr:MAG: hypothetical protein F9K18_04400 [Thermoanaerobaculia bacterium]